MWFPNAERYLLGTSRRRRFPRSWGVRNRKYDTEGPDDVLMKCTVLYRTSRGFTVGRYQGSLAGFDH